MYKVTGYTDLMVLTAIYDFQWNRDLSDKLNVCHKSVFIGFLLTNDSPDIGN